MLLLIFPLLLLLTLLALLAFLLLLELREGDVVAAGGVRWKPVVLVLVLVLLGLVVVRGELLLPVGEETLLLFDRETVLAVLTNFVPRAAEAAAAAEVVVGFVSLLAMGALLRRWKNFIFSCRSSRICD